MSSKPFGRRHGTSLHSLWAQFVGDLLITPDYHCLADNSAVQVIGYSARAVNAAETPDWSQTPFIIQTLLPLLAPALYAASIYMILGRIIGCLHAEHLSFIPVRWLTKIFVFGDILSFAFQCIGELNHYGKYRQKTLK